MRESTWSNLTLASPKTKCPFWCTMIRWTVPRICLAHWGNICWRNWPHAIVRPNSNGKTQNCKPMINFWHLGQLGPSLTSEGLQLLAMLRKMGRWRWMMSVVTKLSHWPHLNKSWNGQRHVAWKWSSMWRTPTRRCVYFLFPFQFTQNPKTKRIKWNKKGVIKFGGKT